MFSGTNWLPLQWSLEPGLRIAAVRLHWEFPAVRHTGAQQSLRLAVVTLGHGHTQKKGQEERQPSSRWEGHSLTPPPIINSGLIIPGGDSGRTKKWILKGAGPISEWPAIKAQRRSLDNPQPSPEQEWHTCSREVSVDKRVRSQRVRSQEVVVGGGE